VDSNQVDETSARLAAADANAELQSAGAVKCSMSLADLLQSVADVAQ
jgi:hypothetical protein